jgi:hypothetical protein
MTSAVNHASRVPCGLAIQAFDKTDNSGTGEPPREPSGVANLPRAADFAGPFTPH